MSVILEHLSVILEHLSVILEHLSVILEHLSVILEHLSVILEHLSVILEHLSVILEHLSVILEQTVSYSGAPVNFFFIQDFAEHCLSFCSFSFGHCIVFNLRRSITQCLIYHCVYVCLSTGSRWTGRLILLPNVFFFLFAMDYCLCASILNLKASVSERYPTK